jgi:nucleoside-diphosphate-sugar epimerase
MLEQAVEDKGTVLVTGATGFVGRHICECLHAAGFQVNAAVRKRSDMSAPPTIRELIEVGDIGPTTSWNSALRGIEAVVHLAAMAHLPLDGRPEALEACRRVNTLGTERLVRSVADADVRRFIYISSIKVNGDRTAVDAPFSEIDFPHPLDAYGQSKWEAEQIIQDVAGRSTLETVILRPPLMYGPGVRANFLALLRWIDRGMPLPFGLIKNRRSMLYVGNLADVIMRCLDAPAAKGQTYLLSDGEDISTPELIERIALLFGHPPRLWPVPVWLLRGLGRLSGRSAAIDRLSGSLVVDSGKIRKDLDWRPPVSCDEGLRATVQWYLAERGKRL